MRGLNFKHILTIALVAVVTMALTNRVSFLKKIVYPGT
jgi:hypothetical protein